MKSSATSVPQYLASIPADRRAALSIVRSALLKALPPELDERMLYGLPAYCVPHDLWPAGHHTNPKLPLMYLGLSSQKNDMVVYMLFLLHNTSEREWFIAAWKATGRKAHIEVGGMACCLRFKKLDDLALNVIAQAIRRNPLDVYLPAQRAMLARIGKSSLPIAKKPKTIAKPTKKTAPSAKRTPSTLKRSTRGTKRAAPGTKRTPRKARG